MENNFDMGPQALIRGLFKVSKKSTSLKKYGSMKKWHSAQVHLFSRDAQREIMAKMHFLPNGPKFFWYKLIPKPIHDFQAQMHASFYFILFIFGFIHLNSILIKIKYKNQKH